MEPQRRVLIVDDERFNINVLAEILKPEYKVMAAVGGAQALKAAAEKQPDLVLLDVTMPEMDGYEVCRRLKSDPATAEIPVIFVTARGEVSDETQGLELGAADYITKPVSAPIVRARVRTQIERLHHLEELRRAAEIIRRQNERMQGELNVARDIQLSMLPREVPEHNEVAVSASMHAAREVGGDFYDFFFVGEHRLFLCVGDVSGKGVPAALVMAITKALIKSRAADDPSTASILTHVNSELDDNQDTGIFVTVFLAVLDTCTGVMTYTNAGHNPPYVRHAGGEILHLTARGGPALGLLDGFAFKEAKMRLGKGDELLIYSDGVTEAMDPAGALYGEQRLIDRVSADHAGDPSVLIETISSDILDFSAGAEQSDDITMLALAYLRDNSLQHTLRTRIRIRNQTREIGRAIDDFGAWAEASGVPRKARHEVQLVLDELLSNVINYGFPDGGEHEVQVQIERGDQCLWLSLSDPGVPFNPLQLPPPDLESDLDARELGGLGIHLTRNLTDDMEYTRGVGRNTVTVTKRWSDAKPDSEQP